MEIVWWLEFADRIFQWRQATAGNRSAFAGQSPIRYRIEFKIFLITFKILNFLAPYLSSLISLRLPSKYNLRNSSDVLLLSYPPFKSKATLGDHSFTCAAPKLWNALPFDISASAVHIFKAKLKTHLFRHAFLSQLFLNYILLLIIVTLAF